MENNLIKPKYKIIEQIGNENYSLTYKVFNDKNNKIYLIKRIPLIDDKDLELLKKEVDILSSVQNENIAKYYGYFNKDNYFNIVMEYCQGLNLKKYINSLKRENKKIDRNALYNYLIGICNGLKEIHSKNISHRDIKPENLILTENNTIKICDLGIEKQLDSYAKKQEDNSNNVDSGILIENDDNDNKITFNNKTDIWSLGCIIYELCTLRSCFEDISLSDLRNNMFIGDYLQLDEELNNEYGLNELIKKMLNKDYTKRPSVEEILDYLQKNCKNKLKGINEDKGRDDDIQKILSSICIIKTKNKEKSFGFLIKIKKWYKMFYYLMGCGIPIKDNIEPDDKKIIICYDNEKRAVEIELNKKERFIQEYNYLNINAFVIELFQIDKIDEKFFLSHEENINIQNGKFKNQEIYFIQYTDNLLKLDNTIIKSHLPSEFKFTLFRKNVMCPGCPIFLGKSSNVFGISSSFSNQNEQYGNFIEPIISSLQNDLSHEEQENDKFLYVGEIREGKKEGYGECFYKNGDYYKGEWVNDKKEGKGLLYFHGERYEGNFKNGYYIGENIKEKKYSFEIGVNNHEKDDLDDDIQFGEPYLEENLIKKNSDKNKAILCFNTKKDCIKGSLCLCYCLCCCTCLILLIVYGSKYKAPNYYCCPIPYVPRITNTTPIIPPYTPPPYTPPGINSYSFGELISKNCKVRKNNKCISCLDGYELIDGNCLSYSFQTTYFTNLDYEKISLINSKYVSEIFKIKIDKNNYIKPISEFIFENKGEHIVYFYIDQQNIKSLNQIFKQIDRIKSISFHPYFNTSTITDMSEMFYNSSLISARFPNFNTNNVLNMSYMFYNCKNLSFIDISNFNSENVKDLSYMFYNCNKLTSIDLNNFKIQNIMIKGMFHNCSSLKYIDISNFLMKDNKVDLFYGLPPSGIIYLNEEYGKTRTKFKEIPSEFEIKNK